MEVELNTSRKQRRVAKLERQVAQYQRRRDHQMPLRSVCELINCVSDVSVETGEVNLNTAEKQQLHRQKAATTGGSLHQLRLYHN